MLIQFEHIAANVKLKRAASGFETQEFPDILVNEDVALGSAPFVH